MDQKVVIAINKLNPSAALSISKLAVNARVIVLKDERLPSQDRSGVAFNNLSIQEVETDYFTANRLQRDIEAFRDKTIGVISRGESSIQYLAKLSDACRDWGLALPTSVSLEIATDKQRMREAFADHCPEVTPHHTRVQDDSIESIDVVEEKVGYPVIVKPANLASSLLIQRCDTAEQLQAALTKAFIAIETLYQESDRHEEPALIVEQMLEGELYSVDTYIANDGAMWHCPPVAYVTGQSIGIDDFFLYRRSAPVSLELVDWLACRRAVEQGIAAIGLRATTAHVELCKTKDGWKIIEIGPRVGRYRIEMYRDVYGIAHSDNDVRVRLGQEPEVIAEAHASCAVYSIYSAAEGILERIERFDAVHELPSLVYVRRLIEDGLEVRHAKNGGHALAEVILSHADVEQFRRDCAWFEAKVRAVVEGGV